MSLSVYIHAPIQISLTAEKVDETPLPQLNAPPLTPQLPLEEVIVKLEAVPEIVNVASVCVDHVPRDKSPPKLDPEWMAVIVALAGRAPPVYEQPLVLPSQRQFTTQLTPVGFGYCSRSTDK